MGKIFKDFNFLIFSPALFLSILSLTLILSLASHLFFSQFLFFLLGFILFFLFYSFEPTVLKSLSLPLYLISLLFLGLSFLGPEIRGTHRWVEAFGIRVQPSEVTRPFLIASFAQAMTLFSPRKARFFFLNLFLMSLPVFLVFKQPDLGNTILYLGTWFGMLFVACAQRLFTFYFLLFTSLFGPILWHFLKDYQKLRILSFLYPQNYLMSASYHSIQAKIAIGSGQFLGKGLGMGTQSHLKFLPEYHTDFIFASCCEELGFLGGVFILTCYFFLLFQILKIASSSQDHFSRLFLVGIFTQFLLQVFINVGMNLGLIPITGITLPLVSYGGSSIFSTLINLGIVSSLGKSSKPKVLVIG